MAHRVKRLRDTAARGWDYASRGVWRDHRNTLRVRIVKVVNLTVKSFMSADIQSAACALTYRFLLALVPALAMLFAIGRGFGFQNILASSLLDFFPAQREALQTAVTFVDSYLSQTSEGLFVGVGIVVLLWTLISLVGAIEDTFNHIWGVKKGRSLWRKATDYTAIFLILPILMVCGSGLTAFMSSSVESHLPFMTPLLGVLLDVASVLFIWLFFTALYMLVPNTKVKFLNALPAGILSGIAYQVLQMLFVGGQVYVSRYNAIYGGFAFVPLLLVWLQLVWLFTLSGAIICYSAQSISDYALDEDIFGLSFNYRRRIGVGMLAVMVQRYQKGLPAMSATDFERAFGVPLRLAQMLLGELEELKLICRLAPQGKQEMSTFQPARDLSTLTVGEAVDMFRDHGTADFIPSFSKDFAPLVAALDRADDASLSASTEPLATLPLTTLGPEHK